MTTLGLTGGVGMGKSTVAGLLARRGLPVVDSDQLARELVEPGQPALEGIRARFGAEMLDEFGRLRRAALASVIFADAAARRDLEAILHPRIRRRWRDLLGVWRAEGCALAVAVIPLLFEVGAETDCTATLCVACGPASQRARLRERGWSETEIARRCAAQWPVERKLARADFVIWTEGGVDLLEPQLDRVLPLLWRWPAAT